MPLVEVEEEASCFFLKEAAASDSNFAKAVLAPERSPDLSALATLSMSVCAWLFLELEVELVVDCVAAFEAELEELAVAEALSICSWAAAAWAACVLFAFKAAARAARSFCILACTLALVPAVETVEEEAAETELMGF